MKSFVEVNIHTGTKNFYTKKELKNRLEDLGHGQEIFDSVVNGEWIELKNAWFRHVTKRDKII